MLMNVTGDCLTFTSAKEEGAQKTEREHEACPDPRTALAWKSIGVLAHRSEVLRATGGGMGSRKFLSKVQCPSGSRQ